MTLYKFMLYSCITQGAVLTASSVPYVHVNEEISIRYLLEASKIFRIGYITLYMVALGPKYAILCSIK